MNIQVAEHHLTLASSNPKTGPIPVSTHTSRSCPDSCNIKKECYAKHSFLSYHWAKISEGKSPAITWKEFIGKVRKLAIGQLWRYAQAGDLPGEGDSIDAVMLKELVQANKRRRGFTYTRKPLTETNKSLIQNANKSGFVVNVSADNPKSAAIIFKTTGLPVVTLLTSNAPNDQKVYGVRVVACPAQKSNEVTCATCALCAQPRDYIIGFKSHGRKFRDLDKIVVKSI